MTKDIGDDLTIESFSPKNSLYYFVELYKNLENKSKIKRRSISALNKQLKTYRYFECKYQEQLPSVKDLDELYKNLKVIPHLNLEEKIIQYWHQGDSAEKAAANKGPWKACHIISYQSIQRYYRKDHILLDKDSLKELIYFPEDISEKLLNLCKMPLLSDLIRTALLYCYGGTWSDFTLYFLNRIPEFCLNKQLFFFNRFGNLNIESLSKTENQLKTDFIANSPYYFGWNKNFKVNYLSSFIHAKEKDPFLGTVLYIMMDFARKEKSN